MGRRRFGNITGIDGLLPIDKPQGMTSHDVVHKVRKHFDLNKVGHGGTLDPNATGLLVLLIGKGTKASQFVMSGDKRYEGVIHLGVSTSSQDSEGDVLEEKDPSAVTKEQLEEAYADYVGDYEQIPPMVSAIKKGGVPLYKMARKGQEIEREGRPVSVYDFEMLDFESPRSRFRFSCTKGTYVRTFCDDVGAKLEVGGHLCELVRLRSGDLDLKDAFQLDDVLTWTVEELPAKLLPVPSPPPAED